MDRDTVIKNFQEQAEKEMEPLWATLSSVNDRGIAINAGCYLDYMLERLIRASYIKNAEIDNLFKDGGILQAYSTKVKIAYFSGLIPGYIYHDLKLMGKLRNKFAHAFASDLSFTSKEIVTIIDDCKLRPKTIDEYSEPHLKFIIIISVIGGVLSILARLVSKKKPLHLMEVLPLNEAPYEELPLTKEQIVEVLSKFKTS